MIETILGSSVVSLYWKYLKCPKQPEYETLSEASTYSNNWNISKYLKTIWNFQDSLRFPVTPCSSHVNTVAAWGLVILWSFWTVNQLQWWLWIQFGFLLVFLEWSTYMAICSSFVLFLCVDRYTVQGIYPEMLWYLEVVHPVDDIEEGETQREQVPDTKSILFLRKNMLIFKVVLLS